MEFIAQQNISRRATIMQTLLFCFYTLISALSVIYFLSNCLFKVLTVEEKESQIKKCEQNAIQVKITCTDLVQNLQINYEVVLHDLSGVRISSVLRILCNRISNVVRILHTLVSYFVFPQITYIFF